MSALHNSEVFGTYYAETTPSKKNPSWTPSVILGTPLTKVTHKSSVKNIALFLAAPFVGLIYALAMPLVGLGALVWFAGKALAAKYPASRKVALAIAAPFIGLAFILTMPLIGLCSLAWIGARSLIAD